MAEAAAAAIPYDVLCERHGQLMEAQAEDRLDAAQARQFVEDAAAAGVQIESIVDRDAIRSMINYWTATIARLPVARPPGDAGAEAPPTPDPFSAPAASTTDAPPSFGAAPAASPTFSPSPARPNDDPFAFGAAPPPAAATPAAAAPPARSPAPEPVARPMLASFDPSQSPKLDDAANPFMGLAAFDAGDFAKYFGRDKVVADLLQLVLASSLVVVSGASGTGKSSLVRAGLISALRRVPECSGWIVATMVPGRDPVASLAVALAPGGVNASEWVEEFRQHLDADPASAGPIVAGRLGEEGLLLVVDQMEELFSLCQPGDRDRAAGALAAIAAMPSAHVVITIREEYLGTERTSHHLPGLDLAAAPEFRVPPLQIEDIRAAITGPAAEVGLVFQDGVVDRIVADVGTDPAALPLLQYALLRLWNARDGNRITMAVYDKVGGPSSALSNAAQEVYDGLGSTQAKENARLIFQQLIRPSLAYEFVRDRVRRGELERLLPPDSIRTVLAPFVAAALIRITPGSDRSEDRVEIVHEALIRNWEPLRRWSFEVRDRERAYLSLDAQAQRWQDSGRAWGHLMFGKALRDAEAVFEEYRTRVRPDPVIDQRVEAFLKASRSSQRTILWIASIVATVVILAGIAALARISILNTRDIDASETTALEIQKVANLSEISAIRGEQARAWSIEKDAARQFIQMLVSRGTIAPSELPPVFAGMTVSAADLPASARSPDYSDDFLGLGRSIEPRVPITGVVQLNLENLRVWFDPAAGVPRLIASQSDRGQPASADSSDALYRSPGLAGQPDEVALARAGIGLTHLVDRREVAWGPRGVEAARGANLIATMLPLGAIAARNPTFGAWPGLQAWMRVNHNPDAGRVLFFSGAVPGAGPVGVTTPKFIWKMAVSSDASGKLIVDAAILPSSKSANGDLPGRTTIDAISRISGIDFSALRQAVASPVRIAPAAQIDAAAPVAVAKPAGARVFLETKGLTAEAEQAIGDALRAQNFTVPRVEHVDPCVAPPEIRYYFRQDAEGAARASTVAAGVARASGRGDLRVTIKRLDANRYKGARPGTIELWVCDPAAVANTAKGDMP